MDWIRKLLTRVAAWIGGRNPEDDTAEEIRLHRSERVAELERAGITRQEADAQAAREFGPALLALEESREAWHLGWIEDAMRDLRYGARAMWRDPAFTATAIGSLALAIGVNTTVFSLTNEFLLSEPSVRDGSRLAHIRIGGNSHASPVEVQFLREAGIFDGLAGYVHGETNWNAGDSSIRLFTFRATPEFFPVIGVPLASGRGILPGDREVAVVSHRFWKSRLNLDPQVLTRTLNLDGRNHSIIGVLTENHRTLTGAGYSPDLYVPLLDAQAGVELYARLSEGMTHSMALARTRAAAAELDRLHPERYYKRAADVRVNGILSLSRLKSGDKMGVGVFFALLMAAVGLVLLIACVNVASLLLARAATRRQEISIRLSIGASRGRLVRQLLAESLLLAGAATGAGIALNLLLTRLLNQVRLPLPVPIYPRIEPDWHLLVYSVALALATAVLAGLLPALKAARMPAPASSARLVGSGTRLRAALVAGQVAVTFVLLTAAILSLRNLSLASALSPGFDVGRLVYASMRLVPERYPNAAAVQPLIASALESLRGMPGVESAAVVQVVPFNDQSTHGGAVRVDGSDQSIRVRRVYNQVSPDYFRTMGIGIVAGREFTAGDVQSNVAVVVVNEAFAKQVWGSANPVGRTIRFGDAVPAVVAGVCRNSKFLTIGEDAKPAVYEPFRLGERQHKIEIMIRSEAPVSLLRAVQGALLALDRSAAVEVRPMSSAMGLAMLPSQVGAVLFGVIGAVGLGLASVGLYGVLVYGVARRVREFGVRMALGASRRDVMRLVLSDCARITAAGLVVGLAAALMTTRPLSVFLIAGLAPSDPLSYGLVALLLLAIALAASVQPSVRAIRVDPSEALRSE